MQQTTTLGSTAILDVNELRFQRFTATPSDTGNCSQFQYWPQSLVTHRHTKTGQHKYSNIFSFSRETSETRNNYCFNAKIKAPVSQEKSPLKHIISVNLFIILKILYRNIQDN